MFEDSLMESQNRLSSPNQRWTTIVSLTLQCSLAATIIALPLLHPEVLPFRSDTPTIALPLKPVPPRIPHVEATHVASTSSAPAASPTPGTPRPDFHRASASTSVSPDQPPATMNIGNMTGLDTIPGGIGSTAQGTGTRVTLAPAPNAGPVHISRGVSAGLLLAPIRPIYPRMAISTRTEGMVVVEAIISKSGHIESARVTSGSELLRSAALDAIRNARYSPYLLNGSPTEVETTITVNFKLSS